ncbi:asparaginyl/glutamyl-tRNA amidotransferase subunit C [Halothiobacillus diazotrophicus]|uniref:Aspartyl/glutamyl-tRNA(Asn/Gln) amidotransferase subunit C n=1 Tax=Halothiobacillus diazotrophicus TaxID=1860122 RepID=A0A191ZGI5_9GAMM|nr:Asp-tRNA(Asn)/Glu-tRNA(Gln) amidotransferase subunit GatC [Halothiobacillus diazotrophicus]ANJ66973.1 asparaginyl/glutamyl-tRNA amidotransferase subunit C [Halothiobacillus diazotrophicus]
MSLNSTQLKHVAHLSRIAVDEAQVPAMLEDLNAILAFAEQLQDPRLDNLAPMAHPLDQTQPLRPDLVTEHDERARLQAGAPAVERGLFLVPQVIES